MPLRLAQLKKLGRMSKDEITVRSRQHLRQIGERLLGSAALKMSDSEFLEKVTPAVRNCSAPGTATSIAERIHTRIASGEDLIIPSLAKRRQIRELIERRFPDEHRLLIHRANRTAAGRFDLLGLTDLSFGNPIDWHLEPLSGKRTPLSHWSRIDYLNPNVAGDKKITWELNRHQHFVTLGQAYWMTDDEGYAAEFVTQLSSWIDANPPEFGINWASSLEVALRAIAWIWALHLFSGSPHLTPIFMLKFLKSLTAHATHIENYTSHYFSPNTHLTGEALGLFYIGSALPELTRAADWRALAFRTLLEQLSRQVRPDGVYFEQSSYYHRYTADFYTHLLLIAQAQNRLLPEEIEAGLELMLDHLMWITEPDGSCTLIGDDDGGKLLFLSSRNLDDFRDTLATGAVIFGRGDWKYVAGEAAIETLWLLGPDGLSRYDEIAGNPPTESARAFDHSGYYVMREGWSSNSNYLVVKSNPAGLKPGAHSHSDDLSFGFSARGKKWLVDPGTFTYTGNRADRDQFRLTSAHNTVTVDGRPQSDPDGPFAWNHLARCASYFAAGNASDYFEGTHSGYQRLSDPVTHTRAILFVRSGRNPVGISPPPAYLVIRDSFAARSLHRYEIRFHFPPDCVAVANGERIFVSEPGGSKLSITTFARGTIRPEIEKGWVSRAYGQREPALVAVLRVDGQGPQEFLSFVIPGDSNNTARVSQRSAGSTSRSFEVQADDSLDLLLVSDTEHRTWSGPLTTSARMAWTRSIDDRLVNGGMVGGRFLEVAGNLTLRFARTVGHCVFERIGDEFEAVVDGSERFLLTSSEPAADSAMSTSRFQREA